jgi:hypothetical protein
MMACMIAVELLQFCKVYLTESHAVTKGGTHDATGAYIIGAASCLPRWLGATAGLPGLSLEEGAGSRKRNNVFSKERP